MKKIEIDGETYTLAEPTDGRIQQQLIALVKGAQQDPLKDVAEICKGFPPEVQTAVLKDAMARKYDAQMLTREERQAQLQSRIEAFVATAEGLEAFLLLLWQRHQPTLAIDRVWILHGKAVEQFGEDYFECDSSASNKS